MFVERAWKSNSTCNYVMFVYVCFHESLFLTALHRFFVLSLPLSLFCHIQITSSSHLLVHYIFASFLFMAVVFPSRLGFILYISPSLPLHILYSLHFFSLISHPFLWVIHPVASISLSLSPRSVTSLLSCLPAGTFSHWKCRRCDRHAERLIIILPASGRIQGGVSTHLHPHPPPLKPLRTVASCGNRTTAGDQQEMKDTTSNHQTDRITSCNI